DLLMVVMLAILGIGLYSTRTQVEELTRRVQGLATPEASDAGRAAGAVGARAEPRPVGPTQGAPRGAIPAGGAPPGQMRGQVRGIVGDQLRQMHERDVMAEEGRVAQQRQDGRSAAVRELGLSNAEQQRLEDLSEALEKAEAKRETGMATREVDAEVARV